MHGRCELSYNSFSASYKINLMMSLPLSSHQQRDTSTSSLRYVSTGVLPEGIPNDTTPRRIRSNLYEEKRKRQIPASDEAPPDIVMDECTKVASQLQWTLKVGALAV